jgi:hypothetical protein
MIVSATCSSSSFGMSAIKDSVVSKQRSDRSSIAQRCLHNLGWIDDTGFDHVDVLVCIGIVAFGLSFC